MSYQFITEKQISDIADFLDIWDDPDIEAGDMVEALSYSGIIEFLKAILDAEVE